MGRLISFVNLNFITTGYWEKRVLSFVFLFACLLAPIPLIKFVEYIKTGVGIKRTPLLANTFLVILISSIMLSGFSTMALQSEYWFAIGNSNSYGMSEKEWQAIGYLKSVLQHDAHAFTITPSRSSYDILVFAAPGYQISSPHVSLFSKYPELPLLTLAAYNLKHAYIYMDTRDFKLLNEQPQQGWFYQHLLPMLPVLFSNGEVKIYNATHISFPSSISETTMLIPTESHDDSWMYAYDIISQSGKNYTVLYDSDPNALKSKTVILSLDPTNYYNYYDDFRSSSIPNGSNWNIISGYWRYSSDGLHGGAGTSNPSEAIILSPVYSKNSTVSTSFKIISTRQGNISIVYSWKDPENYERAGITLLDNKNVYVSWTSIIDGKLSVYPQWPGIKTNLTWKPGDVLNMALSVQNSKSGTHDELFLNGTSYMHNEHAATAGYLGLSYVRTQDAVFDHYEIQELSKLNLRPLSDYIRFVNGGGHLIVLDTNGYGSIGNSMFNSNNMSEPSSLQGSKMTSNSVSISPKQGVPMTGVYDSPQYKDLRPIFVKEAALSQGKITYINIRPILSNLFNNKISAIQACTIFGRISALLGLGLTPSSSATIKQIFATHVATFREMDA
ncbi:MAG: hypothetical protein DLM72_11220 [Candidatus Nitrosopolaris wilkensis]|nr:MAG: hypothetical protein DLM72_11220 [Candidatus Nitrosopolaris wilkensis]